MRSRARRAVWSTRAAWLTAAWLAAGPASITLASPGTEVAKGAAKASPVAPTPDAAPGAENAPAPPPLDVDPLLIEVLTFGPGDHAFNRFGHNALRVRDARSGRDLVFNYGTFTLASPHLVTDFLQRRMQYWLSVSPYDAVVRSYERENRSIEAQVLDLSAADKRLLAERLFRNAQPENRAYRYDYFADNCSTRVRDAIDGVLTGHIHEAATLPGTMSLRAHALRMAGPDRLLYLGLLIVLGPVTDGPIDQWGETFLPEKLQETLRRTRVGEGMDSRPLVKSERVIFAAQRPPPAREPPSLVGALLAIGLVLGTALAFLGRVAGGGRPASGEVDLGGDGAPRARGAVAARIVFGVIAAVAGLLFGVLGSLLLGIWLFTPHEVVYRNHNILLMAPFALALFPLGIGAAAGVRRAMRPLLYVARAAVALAVAGVLIKVIPGVRQDNGALVALMLPLWLGLAFGARGLSPK